MIVLEVFITDGDNYRRVELLVDDRLDVDANHVAAIRALTCDEWCPTRGGGIAGPPAPHITFRPE